MDTVINSFVEKSKEILQDNLVGIYLHGSAVMGCYNPAKSDIDLIVVVKDSIEDSVKRTFMDMVVELNKENIGVIFHSSILVNYNISPKDVRFIEKNEKMPLLVRLKRDKLMKDYSKTIASEVAECEYNDFSK